MQQASRRPPPQVTGISPKEGQPGTQVTIRGENLGVDAKDLIGLRICGVDCLLSAEWQSPKKIIARTGQAKDKGDIIVVTRSGGIGTCTVTFRGFIVQIGPLQDSAVWVDETLAVPGLSRNRASSPVAVDTDSLLGISDESSSSGKKFPDSQLRELFPLGCGNLEVANFEPAWYLLENHQQASFEDLKSGLRYLKSHSLQREEGPMAFVKANVPTFMDCFDTLCEMNQRLTKDQAQVNGGICKPLEQVLLEANQAADAMFRDILRRKERADATRNALGALQRFKFLFNLPCTLERNIKKGDYDLVITDYMRGKSLFGDTDIKVFKKVYDEVERIVSDFRTMLNAKLLQLPSSVEEQKRLIRFLVCLESPGDPAWACLVNMHKWFVGLMHSCAAEHIAKDGEREEEMQRSSVTTGGARASLMHAGRVSIIHGTRQTVAASAGSKGPERVLFLEHLTHVMMDNMPDFSRLGQTYLSGRWAKESKKPIRIDAARFGQQKVMLMEVAELYDKLLRSAFFPASVKLTSAEQRAKLGVWKHSTSELPGGWLPICVRTMRSCISCLSALELPKEVMDVVHTLVFDLRKHAVKALLKTATQDIQALHSKETWIVDTSDEQGATTLLPALFEGIVTEAIQHLQEVIVTRPGEMPLFVDGSVEQEEACKQCQDMLCSFAAIIDQLAALGNVDTKSRTRSLMPELFSMAVVDKVPSLDKRLIIMLSNCHHTRQHILPRVVECMLKNSYPRTPAITKNAELHYAQLQRKLFDSYIDEKSAPIIGPLENNMAAGQFDWSNCATPIGVRRYLKEALMGIIEVEAEVFSLSPIFLQPVLSSLIETVADELSRLIQSVDTIGDNGALQAHLDIACFRYAVAAYETNKTKSSLLEARNYVPLVTEATDRELLEELMKKFRTQMKLQLLCFSRNASTSTASM